MLCIFYSGCGVQYVWVRVQRCIVGSLALVGSITLLRQAPAGQGGVGLGGWGAAFLADVVKIAARCVPLERLGGRGGGARLPAVKVGLPMDAPHPRFVCVISKNEKMYRRAYLHTLPNMCDVLPCACLSLAHTQVHVFPSPRLSI